jgi:hypothetical protein
VRVDQLTGGPQDLRHGRRGFLLVDPGGIEQLARAAERVG